MTLHREVHFKDDIVAHLTACGQVYAELEQ